MKKINEVVIYALIVIIALFIWYAFEEEQRRMNDFEKNQASMKIIISHYGQGKRFTFKDWKVLYNICVSKKIDKSYIKGLYWDRNTEFKKFLLSQ
ncbi:MAG: hypothetical protein KAG14_04075 [Mycoplasmataceae bacterium]|nr:hypothetical protein [Mycoplasmataceae bacterium]